MASSRGLSPYTTPLLLTLLLFALPSHLASLSITNTTLSLPESNPIPNLSTPTAGRDLECFNLTTPKAHPVDTTDCPYAIELLLRDPTGVMNLQQFSHNPRLVSTFLVPHAWEVGSCQVLLTSGSDLAVDTFRLVDVIVKATRIIEECPPKSKKSLGGLALVGNGATFFVAVNGPDLEPQGGVVLGVGGEGEDGAADGEEGLIGEWELGVS